MSTSSNGTFFVESLKDSDTNRNDIMMGYVDFETIYGVEGVGLANIVRNVKDVEGRRWHGPARLGSLSTTVGFWHRSQL